MSIVVLTILPVTFAADFEGTIIKRNQEVVIKYFLESYPKNALVFEMDQKQRQVISELK